MIRLGLRRTDRPEEKYPLPASGRWVLGRQHPSDLVFKSASNISRQHAALVIEPGKVRIEDLDSRNGTWVNGNRVRTTVLNPGDRIRVGNLEFELVAESADEEPMLGSDELLNETHIFQPARLLRTDSSISSPGDLDERAFRNIVRLSRDLIRMRTAGDLLLAGIDLIHELIGADTCEIHLVAPDGTPDPASIRRIADPDCCPAASAGPISRTLLSRVIRERIAILAEDVGLSAFQSAESIVAKGIRSLMAAPMLVDDRLLGVITAETRELKRLFRPSSLEILTAFANLLAVGLEQSRLLEEIARMDRVRQRLAQFHSPAVVEEILRRGGSILPELRTATVWFCDIHGFTPYAERHTPAEVELRVDAFFELAVDTVFEFGGTLDKYLGDGFMAVFGAPIACEDDTIRAVRAAVSLHRKLSVKNASASPDNRICIRSGINTGRVIAGDIGAAIRRDYTVIGDAVNIAQRLQQEIAGPDQIALGAPTAAIARDEFRLRPVGPAVVKGRRTPIEAFLICAPWP